MRRSIFSVMVVILVIGCARSSDDTFRVKTATEDTTAASPSGASTPSSPSADFTATSPSAGTAASPPSPAPSLASHVSASGEVTPQVAPPNVTLPHAAETQPLDAPRATPASQQSVPPPPGSLPEQRPQSEAASAVPQATLSAAVALAMTGPEGTMMGFSVDYRLQGGPPSTGPYYWVIEGAAGKIYRLPVKLDVQGNLMLVVPEWRPEDGPFRCHLEDAAGRAISATVDMK